jgi:hypothetical protein
VIDPIAKLRPGLWEQFQDGEITQAFVNKRLSDVVTDVVSLRKVQPIINIAAKLAGDDLYSESPLDSTIVDLIRNVGVTIDEAYEDTVEVAVESERLVRKNERIIRSFKLLWDKASGDEKVSLQSIGRNLINSLEELLDI